MGGVIIFVGLWVLYIVLMIIFSIQDKKGKKKIVEGIVVKAITTGQTRHYREQNHYGNEIEFTEYEIKYSVDGVEYKAWFHLAPGVDRGDVICANTEVTIRCSQKRPKRFEVLKVE